MSSLGIAFALIFTPLLFTSATQDPWPGLVPITQWRPDTVEIAKPKPIDAYGAVTRKP